MSFYNFKDLKQKARASERRVAKYRKKKEQSGVSLSRPEGDKGLVWDALNYLYIAGQKFQEIREQYNRLKSFIRKASDHTIDDNGRKIIHKQFESAVRNYNGSLEEIEVKGDKLFSKALRETPRELKLSASKDKRIGILIDDLATTAIGFEKARCDNMVHARKTERQIEKSDAIFEKVEKYIANKVSFVDLERSALGMERPDFDALDRIASGEAGQESTGQEVEEEAVLESQSYKYKNLRNQQERAAKAKGRTMALLLDRRG